ncbi:MAG: hypothetical protein V7723_17935 [Sneathiella sp.]|uniref:tyrosine-type recombinase/integrase n=1 Tax=Sneathiella sp. TaxID=1964365 RepID=UPI0030028A37
MAKHRENTTAICGGNVTIYTRTDTAKPVWQGRMSNPDGKGYLTKSLGTLCKVEATEQADDWYRDIKHKLKNNLVINNQKFSQISKIYLEQLQQDIKLGVVPTQHLINYKPAVDTYINPFFDKRNIDTVTQQDINAFKKWCHVYWTTGPGSLVKGWTYNRYGKLIRNPAARSTKILSSSSMNKICVVMREIYRVAVQKGAVKEAGIPKIGSSIKGQGIKQNKKNRRPAFSKAEYNILVQKLRHWPNKARTEAHKQRRLLLNDYVLILANTGIRPGTESDNLRWKDVTDVQQDGETYVQLNVDGKTGERQPIAMPNARIYFDRLKQRRTDVLGHPPGNDEPVFCLPDGTHVKNDYFRAAFKRALEQFGMLQDSYGRNRSPYSLRHTYATLRLAIGVGLDELSKCPSSYEMGLALI